MDRTISHDDLLFLIALAEDGSAWSRYYNHEGSEKAHERLVELKRRTTQEYREMKGES
jgi:hypothetical protein